jgi:hypothetical protein
VNRNPSHFVNQKIEITNRRALALFRLHFNGSPLPPRRSTDRPVATPWKLRIASNARRAPREIPSRKKWSAGSIRSSVLEAKQTISLIRERSEFFAAGKTGTLARARILSRLYRFS